jgi:hypothetical protein
MSIHVVYKQKSCTWFPCLNNAQHSCLNIMNIWNNKFCTDLKQTHEACKFVRYIVCCDDQPPLATVNKEFDFHKQPY